MTILIAFVCSVKVSNLTYKMPGIHERRKYWTSTSDNKFHRDDDPKKYCLKCESYGFPWQPLNERIYQDSELINGEIPRDSDQWIQCYRCGSIYPVEHGKQDNKLKGFIDISDPIHDSRRLKIEHFSTHRKPNKTRKPIDKSNTSTLGPIEQDPDIQQLTGGSGQLQNYTDN